MPKPRRSQQRVSKSRPPPGLVRLPFSKKRFSKVRNRRGLTLTMREASAHRLFAPLPNEVQLSLLHNTRAMLPRKKTRSLRHKLLIEPSFTQVSRQTARKRYAAMLQGGDPLFHLRRDYQGNAKIRPLRSRSYERQSNARLLNKHLFPIALRRKYLLGEINRLSDDNVLNHFETLKEMHDSVPVIKQVISLRLEITRLNMRMTQRKLDYYYAFPSRRSENKVRRLEDSLISLENAKKKYSLQLSTIPSIQSDFNLLTRQANVRRQNSLKAVEALKRVTNEQSGENISNKVRSLNASRDFHLSRINYFEAEMKFFRLYGLVFKDRSENAIRRDIKSAKKKADEYLAEARRLVSEE